MYAVQGVFMLCKSMIYLTLPVLILSLSIKSYGVTIQMKNLSTIIAWYHLFFNIWQNEIWNFFEVCILAFFEVKGLNIAGSSLIR